MRHQPVSFPLLLLAVPFAESFQLPQEQLAIANTHLGGHFLIGLLCSYPPVELGVRVSILNMPMSLKDII